MHLYRMWREGWDYEQWKKFALDGKRQPLTSLRFRGQLGTFGSMDSESVGLSRDQIKKTGR